MVNLKRRATSLSTSARGRYTGMSQSMNKFGVISTRTPGLLLLSTCRERDARARLRPNSVPHSNV